MTNQQYQQYNLLKEHIPHGDVMFPLMVHNFETDCSFKERVSCHWHNEIEILVVTEGQAQVNINNRIYNVEKGSIVFINSNHLHSITCTEGLPFNFFAVVFHENFLNSAVNDVIQQKYIDRVKHSETFFPEIIFPVQEWEKSVYNSLFKIREAFAKKETAFQLLIKSELYTIWYLLYVHSDKDTFSSPRYEDYRITLAKSIIEYIEKNYENHISIPELSNKFNLSEGHLCRFFKTMTNMSVIEYINHYRINVSISMLEKTNIDIGEIAIRTGFNNISYYNKIFKRYMHMTPSQYRKHLI